MTNATCARASDAPTGGYFAHRRRGEPPCADCTRKFVEHNNAYRRSNGRNDRRHPFTCEVCGVAGLSTKKGARFCSNECFISTRRHQFTTAVDVWRPSVVRTPGPRWQRPDVKHPPLKGSLFVYGACLWCDESFMAIAADWERRSLYCSKRCQSAAGKCRRGRFLVPPKQRFAIYERDGWTCQLCGDPVDRDLGPSDPWAPTLDHIVPRSHTLVPDDRPENLQLAHRWCNSVKGDERYYTADDLRAA